MNKIKNICLCIGILILVITIILANVWRPFSNAGSGVVIFISTTFILAYMLLRTLHNKDKNQHPSLYVAKLILIAFEFLYILYDTCSRFA